MIYVLTIGYPQIDRKSNEKITEAILLKDELGDKIKDRINVYDYNIIMVKDLQLLRPQTDFFNEIGEYAGILAFSFWPLDDYYNFDPITQKFYISYSKALKPYILSKKVQGSHNDFNQDHWLGKVFNNYKEYFKYVGGLEPSEYLRKIITLETTNKILDRMLDRMIMRDSKNNSELLNEPIDKVDKQGEQYYDVFATTPGGLTVGAIIQAGKTKLIIHPEPSFKDEDENSFKDFTRKFLDAIEANLLGQTTIPQWVEQLYAEEERKISKEFTDKIIKSSECKEIFIDFKNELNKISIMKYLYFQSGTELQNAVESAFKEIGFEVENVSTKGESVDLVIRFNGKEFLVEVKGKEKYADKEDISNFIANNPYKSLIFVINHFRIIDPKERKDIKSYPPYTSDAIKTIKNALNNKSIESFYPITTMDLAEWVQNKLTPDTVLAKLNERAKIYMQS